MSNDRFFTVRCGPCYGLGKDEDKGPCQVCKGEGLIRMPGVIEDYTDCTGCVGSGFSGFDHRAICVRCLGAGTVKRSVSSFSAKSIKRA